MNADKTRARVLYRILGGIFGACAGVVLGIGVAALVEDMSNHAVVLGGGTSATVGAIIGLLVGVVLSAVGERRRSRCCPACGAKVPWQRLWLKNWAWARWPCRGCGSILTFDYGRRVIAAMVASLLAISISGLAFLAAPPAIAPSLLCWVLPGAAFLTAIMAYAFDRVLVFSTTCAAKQPLDALAANPYASPQNSDWQLTQTHPGLSGTLAKRSWAYRRIEIQGTHSCVLEYNGRGLGYETVLLNGQVAARVSNGGLHFKTPIDFEIQSHATVLAARIEVKTAFLLFLGAFRLSIDGYLVYCEGDW
jgi:hypothetical protein